MHIHGAEGTSKTNVLFGKIKNILIKKNDKYVRSVRISKIVCVRTGDTEERLRSDGRRKSISALTHIVCTEQKYHSSSSSTGIVSIIFAFLPSLLQFAFAFAG